MKIITRTSAIPMSRPNRGLTTRSKDSNRSPFANCFALQMGKSFIRTTRRQYSQSTRWTSFSRGNSRIEFTIEPTEL